MADIDSLQIKIKADANNASNALDKLANSLTNFQKSLSIDTSKLTSISNSIQSIANAASSMNASGIKNISTLTNSINRMGKIDTSGLSNFNPRSHEGSDNRTTFYYLPVSLISIHAPTRGATPVLLSDMVSDGYFNPRSHEGSDT